MLACGVARNLEIPARHHLVVVSDRHEVTELFQGRLRPVDQILVANRDRPLSERRTRSQPHPHLQAPDLGCLEDVVGPPVQWEKRRGHRPPVTDDMDELRVGKQAAQPCHVLDVAGSVIHPYPGIVFSRAMGVLNSQAAKQGPVPDVVLGKGGNRRKLDAPLPEFPVGCQSTNGASQVDRVLDCVTRRKERPLESRLGDGDGFERRAQHRSEKGGAAPRGASDEHGSRPVGAGRPGEGVEESASGHGIQAPTGRSAQCRTRSESWGRTP
jgi:hypothetical protein